MSANLTELHMQRKRRLLGSSGLEEEVLDEAHEGERLRDLLRGPAVEVRARVAEEVPQPARRKRRRSLWTL